MNRIVIYLFLFLNLACSRNSGQLSNPEIESNTNLTGENSSQATNDSLTNVSKTEDITKNALTEDSTALLSREEAELSISYLTLEWETWRILIISFSSLILILLFASFRIFKKNWSLFDEIDEKDKELKEKDRAIRHLELEINALKSRSQKPNRTAVEKNRRNEFKTAEASSPVINKSRVVEDKAPYEKEWSIDKSDSSNLKSTSDIEKIFFAEKATENKIFSSVSEHRNEHRSVFKLILEEANSEKAEFEVVDSEYILKMAVNSPDTYLYPVCKPENSNQNYSGEIITTKRGVAHKVDGKWKVNEEDKATIKFQ